MLSLKKIICFVNPYVSMIYNNLIFFELFVISSKINNLAIIVWNKLYLLMSLRFLNKK